MVNKYSFDKEKLRKLYEYNWNCALCGCNQELEFHHIKHKRELSNSIFNALRICKNCHSKYGSSSAEDIKEHLNLSARVVVNRIKRLSGNDLMFDKKKFLTEIDKNFIKENWDCYEEKLKIKLK